MNNHSVLGPSWKRGFPVAEVLSKRVFWFPAGTVAIKANHL